MRFFIAALAVLSAAAIGFAQDMSFTGGDATYYYPGLGSCGVYNTDADFVVAIDIHTIQSFPGAGTNPNLNPMCGRQIKVTTADGLKSVTVAVEDTCPTCAIGSVDLSPVAFEQLADLSVGRLHNISWTLL